MANDYFKKYKKNKTIGNLTIVIASLIIALSINFLILDNSNFGSNLKSSVLEAKEKNNKADLILENNKSEIILKNTKQINNTKSLSFSINYNPENVEITSINCNSDELIKIENTP
jgi:amino acid permease